MSEELKPCPWCNSLNLRVSGYWDTDLGCFVVCKICEAHGPIYESEEFAVKAWNNRAECKCQSPEEKLKDTREAFPYAGIK